MISFKQQLWVVFKIWIIALLLNTITGTAILGNSGDFADAIDLLLIFGTLYGSLFSLPVALILLLLINRCCSRLATGMWLFWIVLLTGAFCTMATFSVFVWITDMHFRETAVLFITALLSGMIAITTQFKALQKMGNEQFQPESFSF